jgi:DUF971 family protein
MGFRKIDSRPNSLGQSLEYWIQSNTHRGSAPLNGLQKTISGMIVTRGRSIVHRAHDTACGGEHDGYTACVTTAPRHLDLDRTKGLTIEWRDGSSSFYPVEHLRRLSPSAEARELREELDRNPLAILPTSRGDDGPLQALDAELVGTYALRIRFSDGHDTGIYTWTYLRSIDPAAPQQPPREDDAHAP